MSKKLKKKIEEICGLKDLAWEARQELANKILASPEWKQSICNELIGLSFRELERTLNGVASERLKKEESYEHKLEAYRTGKSSRQSKRRSDDSPKAHNPRNVPAQRRTLAEILAQVYAPRVVQGPSDEERRGLWGLIRQSCGSDSEVQSDSSDDDNCTKE